MEKISVISAADLKKTARQSKLKGRQPDAVSIREVRELIGQASEQQPHRADLLIEHLHLLNDRYLGLFERHLCALAHEMNLPMAHVFEVATFYHHFDVLADDAVAPALTVRVCDGLSCQMAGADALLQSLPSALGNQVRVIPAPCIGRCEVAPAVCVGQTNLGHATIASVQAQVDKLPAEKKAPPSWPACVNHADYVKAGGYALAKQAHSNELGSEDAIKIMEQSGLRGLGGAGFPAGRKWRIVREQPAVRLMAINIDEGEPGTFKDRTYLERDPHRFLEGMLIAASVTGCSALYIYLRDEYHDCRNMLEHELAALRANPPYALPLIELRRGAGAYICGEESAMIESIEGKRGEPRMRPPYIAQVGLFGRPTLEHNFETLYWVRDILEKGADWFTSHGRNGRKGLRSFSLSGRVTKPGVKLAPAGITVQELIEEFGGGMLDGHELYAYLPGGASGGILPASLANVPLDFDTLQPYGCFIGSAAVIVLSQHDKARDAALNMMKFFHHESCGQCTPCRVGTDKAATLMQATVWDKATLNDLSTVMIDASICGLGQAAPNPMLSVMKYFAAEVSAS
jgi:formate dehydrogenase beta subunit